jgi:hypothetical protein
MLSFVIVELEVARQTCLGFLNVLVRLYEDIFIFDTPPQPFREDIV